MADSSEGMAVEVYKLGQHPVSLANLRRGNPGHDASKTGRPDLAMRVRRHQITRKALDEAHRLLCQSQAAETPTLKLNDLVNVVATFDDELRIKQSEISFRDPLTVRVVSAE